MPYCPNCYGTIDANKSICNRCKTTIRGKKLDKMPSSLFAFYLCAGGLVLSLITLCLVFFVIKEADIYFVSTSTNGVTDVVQNVNGADNTMAMFVATVVCSIVSLVSGIVSSLIGYYQIKHNATNHAKCNYYSQLAMLIGVIAIIVSVLSVILEIQILHEHWSSLKIIYNIT